MKLDMENISLEKGGISRARFIIGGSLLVGGFLCPLLIPLVSQSDLPANWKAILTTGLVAGLPEIGMLAAVAVLGKAGFNLLKERLFSLFRKHTKASAIGPARYRVGLMLFCLPVALGWLNPYVIHFFPGLGDLSLTSVVITDLVFATSFLVLGAGFWEKIRSLFVHT